MNSDELNYWHCKTNWGYSCSLQREEPKLISTR